MPEVPQGIDKLVAVAALGPEWRAKVLSDPLGAAEEAELELSDSERAIIGSVPRAALKTMVDSFARAVGPRPPSVARTAVRAAAAALLATSLNGCNGCPTRGIQPDKPPPTRKKVEPSPRASHGTRPRPREELEAEKAAAEEKESAR